jgi:hypothetical protein
MSQVSRKECASFSSCAHASTCCILFENIDCKDRCENAPVATWRLNVFFFYTTMNYAHWKRKRVFIPRLTSYIVESHISIADWILFAIVGSFPTYSPFLRLRLRYCDWLMWNNPWKITVHDVRSPHKLLTTSDMLFIILACCNAFGSALSTAPCGRSSHSDLASAFDTYSECYLIQFTFILMCFNMPQTVFSESNNSLFIYIVSWNRAVKKNYCAFLEMFIHCVLLRQFFSPNRGFLFRKLSRWKIDEYPYL